MYGYIEALPASAVFTADGTTAGVITVASTEGFYPFATATIVDGNSAPVNVQITRILTATTLQVKLLPTGTDPNINYIAGSDLSAYTVAQNARIEQPRQVVVVIQPTFVKQNMV